MQTMDLPDTVLKALGPEASRDFIDWLERRLHLIEKMSIVPISALVARQKVNVLILEQVSNLLLADEPLLMDLPDGQQIWRVPIDLTFPDLGRVGRVGELDVDARYGEVRYNDEVLTEIGEKTHQLTQQTLHPAA